MESFAARPLERSSGGRCAGRSTHLASLIFSVLATLATLAPPVAADDDEDANWMPSMTLGVGVATMQISGDTQGGDPDNIPREDGDSYISEFFQFEGRLHTPLVLDIPSRPRLFLSGGFQIPLAEELIAERIDVTTVNRYDPPDGNRLANPADDSAIVTPDYQSFCPDTVPAIRNGEPIDLADVPRNPLARGESCSLRIRNLISVEALWYAGLGIDFSIPIYDFVFRIQPSVDYFGIAVQSEGRVNRETLAPTLDSLEEFANGVGDEDVMHGVSPSLSLAVDVFEEGPWRWSMYVQGRAVHFLNEADIDSRGALQGNALTFVGGVDEWMWQAGAGVRVQWTGRD